MNEQLVKLLDDLSKKLGTTSEYLWGVLIRQAHVSATTTLLYFIIGIIAWIVFMKLHRKFSKENDKTTLYEEYEDYECIETYYEEREALFW